MDPKNMKVVKLKSILKSKGASTAGNKEALVKRVSDLIQVDENKVERDDDKAETVMSSEPELKAEVEESKVDQEPIQELQPIDDSQNRSFEEMEINLLKRKSDDNGVSPTPKRVKGPCKAKNPVMVLNELNQSSLGPSSSAAYTLISLDTTNTQSPWFVMEVEFRGEKFQGGGHNKKDAKQSAAAAALQSIVQFEHPDRVLPFVTKIDASKIDFTSDSMEGLDSVPTYLRHEDLSGIENVVQPSVSQKSAKQPREIDLNKHPVSLLSELNTVAAYECLNDHGPPPFTVRVTVNNNAYDGYGNSKKIAKAGAAIRALRGEFGITMATPDQEAVPTNAESDMPIQIAGELPDFVYDLIRNKLSELTSDKADLARHKVLAGIVMTRGGDNNGEVISLATGTKCIKGGNISKKGATLFDCHAEIVARRGLRRFLYQQLLAYARGEISIYERCLKGGYRLKEEIAFHLYINTAPCGDARIFSPSDASAEENDNHPNRRSRGLLRTKIENGEGTIPVDTGAHIQERGKGNVQQTWDAIISGERLLTMSCSDKIAKWNVLGLQGSLLSLYIEPVYLSSIILGSLYHCRHMQRAVYTRVKEAIEAAAVNQAEPGLPDGYRIHRPGLAAVPQPSKRKAMRAPAFCLHWTRGEEDIQVICTGTGVSSEKVSSNLCKVELMKLMKEVMSTTLQPRVPFNRDPEQLYSHLKSCATDYQEAKYLLMTGLHKAEYGAWVGKPCEVDEFVL